MTSPNENNSVTAVRVTKHAIGAEIQPPPGSWTLVSSQVIAVERKSGDEPAPVTLDRNAHNRRMRVWLHEDTSRKKKDFVDPHTGATTDENGFGTLPESAQLADRDYIDETVYLTWSRT